MTIFGTHCWCTNWIIGKTAEIGYSSMSYRTLGENNYSIRNSFIFMKVFKLYVRGRLLILNGVLNNRIDWRRWQVSSGHRNWYGDHVYRTSSHTQYMHLRNRTEYGEKNIFSYLCVALLPSKCCERSQWWLNSIVRANQLCYFFSIITTLQPISERAYFLCFNPPFLTLHFRFFFNLFQSSNCIQCNRLWCVGCRTGAECAECAAFAQLRTNTWIRYYAFYPRNHQSNGNKRRKSNSVLAGKQFRTEQKKMCKQKLEECRYELKTRNEWPDA